MIPSQFVRRQNNHQAPRRHDNRRRLLVESLEGRQLLSTFTVTNVNDSGSGSLRQAIISSDSSSGSTVNTINFDIGTGGVATIALKSGLPAITHPVVIDGTTQPGTGTTPGIVLNGASAGKSTDGLTVQASNSTVKGLVVDYFGGTGVLVSGASGDTITDDYIGVTAAGNVAAGNGYDGIHFTSGAQENVVSDDVISANVARGVEIEGGSHNNTVEDCMIGTDVTGTKPLGNGDSGVLITDGSNDNVVGGTTAAARNVISANENRGVHITTSSGNLVEGNDIGTDVTGTKPLGNVDSGVLIDGGSTDNVVGGTTVAAGNVISANQLRGVHITSSSANLVEGNDIGTDVTGTKPLGNGDSGVLIDGGSTDNVVGGTTAAARNVISANQLRGVHITSSSANLVEGNYIGTDVTGTKPLGNGDSGVLIDGGSTDNVVGGTTAAARNVISANQLRGVHITSSSGNLVEGNYIGTDVTGTKPLGNGDSNVLIDGGSSDNVIGGTTSGAGNTIAYSGQNGVHLDDASTGNLIEGDTIDDNAQNGVEIDSSPNTSVINCTIESNDGWGILVTSSSNCVFTNDSILDNGLGGVKD